MKIAYLVNQYPTVSHTFIRREIHALEAMGHQVERLSVRHTGGDLPDSDDRREAERTKYVLEQSAVSLLIAVLLVFVSRPVRFVNTLVLAIGMARADARGIVIGVAYAVEACWISRCITASGIEHLHAHFGTNPAAVARLVYHLTGIDYSFTVHGPEEFDRPQALQLSEKVVDAKFAAAISSFGRSQLHRWVPMEQWQKIHVVRCGLDESQFGALPPPDDVPLLLCIGRLTPQKGQMLLVDAAAQLVERGYQFKLVFVGDGELRSVLEARIKANALTETVSITGWQSNDQVREWLGRSRAMVLPSSAEGLPVVIMEALAAERPVVSTYVAGIPELVTEECGWLFPAGDLSGCVDAVAECLNASGETIQTMGAFGARKVAQKHCVTREVSRLSELMEFAA